MGNTTLENRKSKIREKLNKENIKDLNNTIKQTFNMDVEDLILALADKNTFKEKFLIPHYKMYNLLKKLNTEIEELSKKDLSENEIQSAIKNLSQIKLELSESRIELYFCNAMEEGHNFIKFCADIVMTYGLTHTGLLIDDVVIQWGRGILGDSICHPAKTAKYNDYIYAIELENKQIWNLIKETFDDIYDYIKGKKKLEEMGTIKAFQIAESQLDIISETVVYYNVEKTYNIVLENCQHFVKKILNKMNLKLNTYGEVGRILKIVEDKGNIIDFVYNNNKFNTRKELDEFIIKCNFKDLPKDHRRLLFCYKNVFEYYSRYRKDEKYKATEEAKIFWRKLHYSEKFEK